MNLTKNEYEYARIAAAEAKKPFNEILESMIVARDIYGVSFRHYCNIKLYKFTEKTVTYQGERLQVTQVANEAHYEAVCEATGRTRAQIQQDIAILNSNPYTKVDIAQYHDLKLYDMNGDKLKNMLIALRDRRTLNQQLTKMLKDIDS